MSLLSSLGLGRSPLVPADREGLVSRYQRLRAVKLGDKLARRLSKDDLHAGARKLGMLHRGTLVFDSEDQMPVLMDYCIYDVFRNGQNAVAQYLAAFPDSAGDEALCLQAMQRATYSLLTVESVERELGIIVQDLRTGESTLVVDMGLSVTALPGLVLATRLLPFDGLTMTGGAALPVAVLHEGQDPSVLYRLADALVPDEQGYCDPATLIRACLESGSSEMIAYAEAADSLSGPPQPKSNHLISRPALTPAERRNAPCPCGSGKKLKHCCLRKLGRRAK